MKILVINPGSTSTKLAVYENENPVWRESIAHPSKELADFHHINEQYEYRRAHVHDTLEKAGIPLAFDAVIARGGLLKPTPGGVYQINERIKHDLWHASMEHASNLAAWIADEIAHCAGCPSYLADPVVTDELREYIWYPGASPYLYFSCPEQSGGIPTLCGPHRTEIRRTELDCGPLGGRNLGQRTSLWESGRCEQCLEWGRTLQSGAGRYPAGPTVGRFVLQREIYLCGNPEDDKRSGRFGGTSRHYRCAEHYPLGPCRSRKAQTGAPRWPSR